jgi:hypothetical protein
MRLRTRVGHARAATNCATIHFEFRRPRRLTFADFVGAASVSTEASRNAGTRRARTDALFQIIACSGRTDWAGQLTLTRHRFCFVWLMAMCVKCWINFGRARSTRVARMAAYTVAGAAATECPARLATRQPRESGREVRRTSRQRTTSTRDPVN